VVGVFGVVAGRAGIEGSKSSGKEMRFELRIDIVV
jgi:hypothetical protein